MYWLQRYVPDMLREDRIDVFWGQNHMLPVGRLDGCLRLLTIHDLTAVVMPGTMPLRARIAARLHFARVARVADRVLVDSEASARLAQLCLQVPATKLRVLYQGVDPAFRGRAAASDGLDVRCKYSIPDSYLLTVGTIEPRKEHGTLLRALELVPTPLLVIVGSPGWKCRPILRRIRRLEAGGRARCLGPVSDGDLVALYRGAALMVYPSAYEGFGLPIAEAMSCGCPVLCSWTSSLPEVGGAAARYFRARDPQDLAARLHALLADAGQLEMMARAGRERAMMFDCRRAAQQFVGEVRQLAESRRSAGRYTSGGTRTIPRVS